MVYSNNNSLSYVLTKARLDATGHWWRAQLATYHFRVCYLSAKSNVEADALSRIEWSQVKLETVKAILHATADGPEAVAKVYVCSVGACPLLIPFNTVKRMTAHDWAAAQR